VKSVSTPLASARVLEASVCSLRKNDLDVIVIAVAVAPIATIVATVVVVVYVVVIVVVVDDERSF